MESLTTTSLRSKREYWQKHITRWNRCGMSQRQYCQNNSLPLSTFGYWKRKLQVSRSEQSRFYPLAVPSIPVSNVNGSDSGLCLFLRDKKFQIDIAKNFSATSLKKLISTLEEV